MPLRQDAEGLPIRVLVKQHFTPERCKSASIGEMALLVPMRIFPGGRHIVWCPVSIVTNVSLGALN
jgi:hypothetical protein